MMVNNSSDRNPVFAVELAPTGAGNSNGSPILRLGARPAGTQVPGAIELLNVPIEEFYLTNLKTGQNLCRITIE